MRSRFCDDNPVRAIDVLFDELIKPILGFGGVERGATGRPLFIRRRR
jgi:hypothetical protein